MKETLMFGKLQRVQGGRSTKCKVEQSVRKADELHRIRE